MAAFDYNDPAEIVQGKYERSIDLANQALRATKSMEEAFKALLPIPPAGQASTLSRMGVQGLKSKTRRV